MLTAANLRLAMHDLVCMSGCGRVPDEWPDDVTEEFRQEYITHTIQARVRHAQTMARHAKAFRAPGVDRLQVVHDAICRAGADCPQGPAHLPDGVRGLVAEWEAA